MRTNRCGKCQGPMAEGFMLDRTESGRRVSAWIEGSPVKSFWMGLRLRGRRKLEVQTHRCTRCGFLESYAIG